MVTSIRAPAIATLLSILALLRLPASVAASCDAVHLFLARGNNEPYPGRQASVVNALCSGLPSCGYEDIQFSAELDDVYCESIHEGAVNGIAQLTAYAASCPDAKLVLSGYSEGANIVGDILGGGGGSIWGQCDEAWVNGLTWGTAPASQIAGVLIFGDVRHTANQAYNVLSGAGYDSAVPRNATMLAAMNNYAGVMRSYCDAGDPVCAGGSDVSTHLNYLDLYSDSAAQWVKSIAGLGTSSTSVSTVEPTSASVSSTIDSTTTVDKTTTTDSGASTTSTSSGTTSSIAPSTTSSLSSGSGVPSDSSSSTSLTFLPSSSSVTTRLPILTLSSGTPSLTTVTSTQSTSTTSSSSSSSTLASSSPGRAPVGSIGAMGLTSLMIALAAGVVMF